MTAGTTAGGGAEDPLADMTGLAGSALRAAETAAATIPTEAGGRESVMAGDNEDPDGDAATAAVASSSAALVGDVCNDETTDPALGGSPNVATNAEAIEEADGRYGSSTAIRGAEKPADGRENGRPDAGGGSLLVNNHGEVIAGGGGENVMVDARNNTPSLHPPTVALLPGNGGLNGNDRPPMEPETLGETDSSELSGAGRREAEPSEHPDRQALTFGTPEHAREESETATGMEAGTRHSQRLDKDQRHRRGKDAGEVEDEDREAADRQHFDAGDGHEELPLHSRELSCASPAAGLSTPGTRVSTEALGSNDGTNFRDGQPHPENALPSGGQAVDVDAPADLTTSAFDGLNSSVGARTRLFAGMDVSPVDAAASRPLYSQEETEIAMAALIAKLRTTTADLSLPQEHSSGPIPSGTPRKGVVADGFAAEPDERGDGLHEGDSVRQPGASAAEEKDNLSSDRVLENTMEKSVLLGGQIQGALTEHVESEPSEAAAGIYEDDFDDD